MAVNKNFTIRNGLEVKSNLILADATLNKVGIGTSVPSYKLHVNGGIGATSIYVSSASTITELSGSTLNYTTGTFTTGNLTTLNASQGNIVSGVVTSLSGSTLNYSGIATVGSLSIGSTQIISAARQLQNIASLDATTTATIEAAIANAPNTFTDLVVTGVSTLGVTSATDLTAQNLYVSGIGTIVNGSITNLTGTAATITTLRSTTGNFNTGYIVTGVTTNFTSTNGSITNLTGTAGTITTLSSTNGSITNLTGTAATIGTVKISSGIITATSGIVTYYGDGQYLTGVISGVGINTAGGNVGYGATLLDFRGAGISTVTVTSGIATINITGGSGGGASVSISTDAPASPSAGDLWYNNDLGRTFIYYDEVAAGVGLTAFWVDAAPFNVGIITALTNVSFNPGSASSPSIYFVGDVQTGFFSPALGEITFVSAGSSVLNVNSSGIVVTGVTTSTDFNSSSDASLKKDIVTISNGLELVEKLRGVNFTWIADDRPSAGVIAQEVEEVLPQIVGGDVHKAVNYNGLIGVLIEAVKELSAEVKKLKDQLNK
jgi:hypothetical protein